MISCAIPKSAVGDKAPLLFSNRQAYEVAALLSNLNSFTCDYAVRQKVGGTDIGQYHIKQFPVHPPERYTSDLLEYIVPRVLELTYTAWDLAAFADDVWSESAADLRAAINAQWEANVAATGGGHQGKTPPDWIERSSQAQEEFPHAPFMWDDERRAQLRADLDGLYGYLYGLDRSDLAYILGTFPIVQRKDEAEYGEYRTKRLVLEAYDRLAGSALFPEAGSALTTITEEDEDELSDDSDAHRDGVEAELRNLFGALDDEPSATEEGKTETTEVERTRRSDAFRIGVRKLYGYRCCVCGLDARGTGDGGSIVDAAHIVPKADGGPDDPRNGLALCKNHHWAYDHGLFRIDPETRTVQVTSALPAGQDTDFIERHDGEPIAEPEVEPERYRPHGVFLEWQE